MRKAQGALEYLLLIGGGVLVSVIVVTLILGISDTSKESAEATVTSGFERIAEAREGLVGEGGNVVLSIKPEESGTLNSTVAGPISDSMQNPKAQSSTDFFTTGSYSIKLTADDTGIGYPNYTYVQVWVGNYVIQAGDVLKYSSYIPLSTSDAHTMVEATISGGPRSYLRWNDGAGYWFTSSQNSLQPKGTWNNYSYDLTGHAIDFVGATITAIYVVKDTSTIRSTGTGSYISYFDNIRIVNTEG